MEVVVETKKDKALRFVKTHWKEIGLTVLGVAGVGTMYAIKRKPKKVPNCITYTLQQSPGSRKLNISDLGVGKVENAWLSGDEVFTAVVENVDWQDLGRFGKELMEAASKLTEKALGHGLVVIVNDEGKVFER